jgi:hypothetical protein
MTFALQKRCSTAELSRLMAESTLPLSQCPQHKLGAAATTGLLEEG